MSDVELLEQTASPAQASLATTAVRSDERVSRDLPRRRERLVDGARDTELVDAVYHSLGLAESRSGRRETGERTHRIGDWQGQEWVWVGFGNEIRRYDANLVEADISEAGLGGHKMDLSPYTD